MSEERLADVAQQNNVKLPLLPKGILSYDRGKFSLTCRSLQVLILFNVIMLGQWGFDTILNYHYF